MRIMAMLALAAAMAGAAPAAANLVVDMTFAEKMAQSELVVIATATANHRRSRETWSSTATLTVLRTLKGEAGPEIEVLTSSRIAEMDPHCCEVGATYLMFLSRLPDGRLASVHGAFGMVQIGGRPNAIQVVPGPGL